MIKLKFAHNLYWIKTDFENRNLPLTTGFQWNRAKKLFFTKDPYIAKPFLDRAVDAQTHTQLSNAIAAIDLVMSKSMATTSDLDIPKPEGLEYYPFQKAGIEFALSKDAVLIADEMGIGKTIEAIGVMNYKQITDALIICPAAVKINWQRELEKWLVDYIPVGVAFGSKPFPTDSIKIINYDILAKFHKKIHGRTWDLLIVDECHYVKNPESKRTVEVVGERRKKKQGIKANRKLFLTGTPILNRPKELFSYLNYLDPKNFPSFWKFGIRYCGGYSADEGWDFSGATNLDELNRKLRSTIMVRRLKKNVLKDLPDKVRQIIELPANGKYKTILRVEKQKVESYMKQVQELGVNTLMAFAELAVIRHETALAKVPMVIDHLREIIDAGEKVVCFAWHRDVIAQIHEAFKGISVAVTGSTLVNTRQAYVDMFQEGNGGAKLFIGNIKAAGTGITLTAASRVVFAELDWVPGNVTQAEDRCHRIGQKNSVHVQHLVLENSIDAYMAKILVHKQSIIDQAIDGKGEELTRQESREILTEIFNNY